MPAPTPNTNTDFIHPRSGRDLKGSMDNQQKDIRTRYLFTNKVLRRFIVFSLYGGYLSDPNFSVNLPRSFFRIG